MASSFGGSRPGRFSGIAVLAVVLFSAIQGCGGGGDGATSGRPRVEASGKVQFDGKPVPGGFVSFAHKESGTISVCPISDGAFESNSGEGPLIGDSVVTVNGLDKADDLTGKPLWSGNWSKEVKVEESGYTGDFSITAAEVKPYVEQVDE